MAEKMQVQFNCQSVGFEIIKADYAPDARWWWEEYAKHDPGCQVDLDGEKRAIQMDNGRWISFGYVIAKKPSSKSGRNQSWRHIENNLAI
ncbi:MAG: hypothetical protein JXA89_23575 [Anaerolineae bacterium]|nr:hypothetical protein [Anaerolineae bacterium]